MKKQFDVAAAITPAARADVALATNKQFPELTLPPENRFDMSWGWPAPETYPLEDLAELTASVLRRDGRDALGYMDPREGFEGAAYGDRRLREEVVRWIEKRDGRTITTDSVIVTHGSTQAIQLVIRAFLGIGEVGYVEAATYSVTASEIESVGAEIGRIPFDSEGMDIDFLESRIRADVERGLKPKLVYTVATFSLAGGVLSPARRARLLQLAEEWDLLVVEDNLYRELRFEGDTIPTLFSTDESGRVIQIDGVSKTIATGIRIGWATGAPDAIRALANVRDDLGVGQYLPRVIAEFFARDLMEPHLELIRRVYHERRDIVLEHLGKVDPELLRFDVPQGSFYVWLTLGDEVDWVSARREIVKRGVLLRNGEHSLGADFQDSTRYLRLSYGRTPLDELAQGAALLAEAIEASEATPARPATASSVQ